MKNYHLCFVDSIRSFGGAEVWFLETARALGQSGYKVSIVAQPDSQLHNRALAAGISVAAIPIRFDSALWTLLKLARYFRTAGVTAIVANLTKDLKAASVAGRLAGVPVILATRESDFPLKDKAYYRWYFGKMSTGMVVNSEATRQTVIDSVPWLDTSKIHLLYKGIDTDRFRRVRPRPAKPIIGFVGQLIERKGLREIMSAWSIVDAGDRAEKPVLRLAGEGLLESEIRKWKQTLKNPEQVELAGFVENIETFYQGLTMLLLPSHAEGFGLAAAEASACEIPVIATDTSSLPEIVRHNSTGLLIPTHNAEKLAAAIIDLLDEPDKSSQFGLGGRLRIVDKFNRTETLKQLLDLTDAERAER